MANNAGSVVVDLILNDSKYKQGWGNASRTTKTATTGIGRDVSNLGSAFTGIVNPINNIGGALRNLATVAATALSAQKIVQYSDTFRGLESRLKLVTASAAELQAVQSRLFDISQANAQPLADTIDAYNRLQNSLTGAQKSQVDLIRFTELLSKTLKISGTNAAGAATFFQQFGQAASSDFKAVGQELQTFADQNPRFYRVLQESARSYGKTLKQMGVDGELSFQLIADALIASGAVIDKESGTIAKTVGQAFTQLDNAFLKYIGQSEAVKEGTSTIAIAVSGLANNLDLAVKIVTLASTIFVARFIPSVVASGAAMATMATQTLAVQVALGRMSGLSTTAATSLLGLSVAARGVGAALALVGGPLGLAFIAAATAFTLHTNEAAAAEERYAGYLNDTAIEFGKYATASKDARDAANRNSQDRIEQLQKELSVIDEMVVHYASLGSKGWGAALGLTIREVGGKLGLGTAPSEVMEQYDAILKTIRQIREERERAQNSQKPGADPLGIDENEEKRQKSINALISSLKQESDILNTRVILFDEEKSAVDAAIKSYETYVRLQEIGGKLTKTQSDNIRSFLDNIEAQSKRLEELNKEQERLKKLEEDRKRALEDLGNVIGSAFEDAIVEGGKLSDVLSGLLQDILRIIVRLTVVKPLVESIGNSLAGSGGGGLLGSLFGGLFGSSGGGTISPGFTGGGSFGNFANPLASYDVGAWRVMGDQVAQIHDGEMIIPKNQADMLRAGSSGGGSGIASVTVNNYGDSKVKVNQSQTNRGLDIEILIDELTANNMQNPSTKTGQAMLQTSTRSLVRR